MLLLECLACDEMKIVGTWQFLICSKAFLSCLFLRAVRMRLILCYALEIAWAESSEPVVLVPSLVLTVSWVFSKCSW